MDPPVVNKDGDDHGRPSVTTDSVGSCPETAKRTDDSTIRSQLEGDSIFESETQTTNVGPTDEESAVVEDANCEESDELVTGLLGDKSTSKATAGVRRLKRSAEESPFFVSRTGVIRLKGPRTLFTNKKIGSFLGESGKESASYKGIPGVAAHRPCRHEPTYRSSYFPPYNDVLSVNLRPLPMVDEPSATMSASSAPAPSTSSDPPVVRKLAKQNTKTRGVQTAICCFEEDDIPGRVISWPEDYS